MVAPATDNMRDKQSNTHRRPSDQGDVHASSLARAWRLRGQSLWKKAADICHWHLSHNNQCGEAWHLLGVLAHDKGYPSQAFKYLKKAILIDPRQPAHYNNLGYVLNSMGRYVQAETCLRKALDLAPDFHDARCNLGLSLYHQNHLARAARCFEEILRADPNHDAALANLGMTRLAQQMYPEAAAAYEKAIAVNPNQAQWHGNLGAARVRLGDFEKAAQCYRQALALDGDHPDYGTYLGIVLRAAGNLLASIRVLEEVVLKDSTRSSAVANLVTGLEYTCQWDKLELYYPLLDQQTHNALLQGRKPDEDPMLNIRHCSDVTVNQSVSRHWSQKSQRRAQRIGIRFSHSIPRDPRRPITIGYLSYDFRNHPVAHQIHPMFGMHDRSRFRIVAFSMGPNDHSVYRKEIEAGCDEFVDISTYGLSRAAQAIYDRKIDILVDLMGHSHHNRMEILALRPAPLQVGYLGFLSTTGAPYVDYLIADSVVAPKDHNPYYDEKLLRLPHCYQFNHNGMIGGPPDTHREDWGLPPGGFVFCCFNNVYKIDRELFDTWMRILHRTPGTVLWLNGGNQMASQHMQTRARALGIDLHRLVFAKKLPLQDHLHRIAHADLALDSLRYNGGATTANALGAGVPVITVMGRHWVSRMAASHLIAAGLPELVFPSMASYEEAAIDFAANREKLLAVQKRLLHNNKSHPLFDSQGFIRQLESGFEVIWRRYKEGQGTAHIDIKAENTLRPSADEPVEHDASRTALDHVPSKHSRTKPAGDDTHRQMQPIIYYFCPNINGPSAGIRRLHRHVSILHQAGFPVFLLNEKQGFDHPDMPRVPTKYLRQVGPQKAAIFVIPEGMPRIMHQLKDHPGRRFVIALSWSYIFSTLPDGLDWRHMNIERVLAVSPVVGQMIRWSMGLPVHQLASGIDHRLYYHIPEKKQKQIAFIQRKAGHIKQLKGLIASRNPDYINKIKWVGLKGLSQQDYAAQIRRCAIFLSTSMAEGFPTSCLEAMAAGAVVAGYDGVGGRGILRADGRNQNAILSSNGDYVSLAYQLLPLLDDLLYDRMDRWQPMLAQARQTALTFSAHKEASSLITFWKPFVYGETGLNQEDSQKDPNRMTHLPTAMVNHVPTATSGDIR